jgi:predicted ATP-dependent endonuclease of OLD family
MKLDYLKIDEFKNLRDFEINFDEGSQTTVLVGRNGSGKSNLLEALTLIFRDLDLGEPPAFSYELHYYCRDFHIKIHAKKDAPSKDMVKIMVKDKNRVEEQPTLLIDEDTGYEDISYSRFKQGARKKYLPN